MHKPSRNDEDVGSYFISAALRDTVIRGTVSNDFQNQQLDFAKYFPLPCADETLILNSKLNNVPRLCARCNASTDIVNTSALHVEGRGGCLSVPSGRPLVLGALHANPLRFAGDLCTAYFPLVVCPQTPLRRYCPRCTPNDQSRNMHPL